MGVNATLPKQIESTPGASTFDVHLSDPTPSARLRTRPQSHWKLAGRGQLTIDGERVVVSGRRPRFLWSSAREELSFAVRDILNVVREGRIIQFHVRIPGGREKPLKLWASDDRSAEQILERLPKDRTPQFEQLVVERSAFEAALKSLGTRAVVTPALVIVNCVVFAATVASGAGLFQTDGAMLVHWGTNFGAFTLDGEWWRLFTSMFLHFGVLHLLFNMWALWSLGPLAERLFGSVYYFVLYLFAGLCGSVASLLWHPYLNSAGASGAIFGVLGGLLAFMVNPGTRIPASISAAQRNSALIFIAYNLLNGFSHSGIDNADHIGGLLGGFAMGWLLARPLTLEARQEPGRRLAGSLLAGMAVLLGMSWTLIHPSATVAAERKFGHQLLLYADDEQKALASQGALERLRTSHQITPHEWGRRITTEVLPAWQAGEDRLLASPLPAQSRLVPLRSAMLDYLDQKREALQLLSQGARYDNDRELERGTELLVKNNAESQQIQALIRQLYY
jgi:rhomboid protease GluP